MGKNIKKLFYALMLVLGMSVLSSCSKEGNGTSIVGTWKSVSMSGLFMDDIDGNTYWQFKDNGTCVIVNVDYYYTDVTSGTWRLSGDTLTFGGQLAEDSDLPPIFTVMELTKNSMTLVYMGGLVTCEFKRVSDSEIEKYL